MGDSPKWVKSKRRRKKRENTAGGPGGRDRTLGEKRRKNARKSVFFVKKKLPFFLHIFSSYANILGETNVKPWEFPQSGSKAKDGEKRERERERKRERAKIGNNNGQLRIANATSSGAHKATWAKNKVSENIGQLCLQPPPRVAHASRLDQQWPATFINATSCCAHKLSGPKKEGDKVRCFYSG